MEMGQPKKNKKEIFTSYIFNIIIDVVNFSDYVATRKDE
jgi:hypothetical protein